MARNPQRRFLAEVQSGLQTVNRSAFGAPRSTQQWGHVELMIPAEDMAGITARNPRLLSKDREEREAAWDEFMASDASLPYRVPVRDTARIVLSGSRRNASRDGR